MDKRILNHLMKEGKSEVITLLGFKHNPNYIKLKNLSENEAVAAVNDAISTICSTFAISKPDSAHVAIIICTRIISLYGDYYPVEIINAFLYGCEDRLYHVNTEHYGRPFNLDSCSKILKSYSIWRVNTKKYLETLQGKLKDMERTYMSSNEVKLLTEKLELKKI